jgi:hypothetical protein
MRTVSADTQGKSGTAAGSSVGKGGVAGSNKSGSGNVSGSLHLWICVWGWAIEENCCSAMYVGKESQLRVKRCCCLNEHRLLDLCF